MAIGRAVFHRELAAPTGEWTQRLWRWRHGALLLLALLAGAMASVSLVKHPSDEPPPATSYLPASEIAPP